MLYSNIQPKISNIIGASISILFVCTLVSAAGYSLTESSQWLWIGIVFVTFLWVIKIISRALNLERILRKLSLSTLDTQERLKLCQRALSLFSPRQNPVLWAKLNIDVGDSTNNPDDNSFDPDLAIKSYENALTVINFRNFKDEWEKTIQKLGICYENRGGIDTYGNDAARLWLDAQKARYYFEIAFRLVEVGDISTSMGIYARADAAINLLVLALRIHPLWNIIQNKIAQDSTLNVQELFANPKYGLPLCGDIHNELAFVYGKGKDDLDLAEKHAWFALDCKPDDRKFYNAVNGIQLHRMKRLETRREIREYVRQRLEEIEYAIRNDSSYKPAYLSKAVILALSGEPEDIWEKELATAEQLYLADSVAASNLPLTLAARSEIFIRNRELCKEVSEHWMNVTDK